jgi:8-oxo-dGTP diphosphatase
VPKGYDADAYPRFAVTVDVVILTIHEGELSVLLVQRGGDPYRNHWALPGGFKRPDETLDQAARRELLEETGITAPKYLDQLKAYGDPERDPRGNVVTVAYLAVVAELDTIRAGSDADGARLVPVRTAIARRFDLAFDHERILRDALERVERDLENSNLATAFVGPTFTLSELRAVYERVWEKPMDAGNFRRSLISPDVSFVESTGSRAPAGPEGGRPPELFRATKIWEEYGSPVKRMSKRSATGPSEPRKREPRRDDR